MWIFIKDKNIFFYTICFVFYRGITLVCLNCDFLTDVSGLDNMATHLSQHETHACQVVIEKGTYIKLFYFGFLIFIPVLLVSHSMCSLLNRFSHSSYFICCFKYNTFLLISVSVCIPTSEHLSE